MQPGVLSAASPSELALFKATLNIQPKKHFEDNNRDSNLTQECQELGPRLLQKLEEKISQAQALLLQGYKHGADFINLVNRRRLPFLIERIVRQGDV